MASTDHPGQIIVIDSSDQESLPSRRKRTGSSSSASNPRHVKRPRTGSDSVKLQVSEEGEVQSSEYQSTASMGRRRKSSSESDMEGNASTGDASQAGVMMPVIPTYWTSKQGARFKIPAFAELQGDSWPNRFTNWVRVFFINNLETQYAITPNLSMTAFEYYLDKLSGIRMNKRQKSKQAARQCQKTGQLKSQLASLRKDHAQNSTQPAVEHQSAHERVSGLQVQAAESAKAATSAAASPRSEAPMTRPPAPTGSQEHAQQLKYFPSASDPSKVCILCGQESHLAAACPQSACRFCDGGHWEFCCPTKARCTSCLQLGHDAHACANDKSKPAIEESMPCAFCESRNHLDSECPEVCRSYRPEASTIKKVEQLPVSCAICASRDHYLYDCALRLTPAITVWSYTHYSQYLDPECGVPGIEATHYKNSKTRADKDARGFKGLGRPSRPNTIKYYISSDDESDDQCPLFTSKPAAGSSHVSARGPSASQSWASAARPQAPSQGQAPIRFNLQPRGARPLDPPASYSQSGGNAHSWDSGQASGRGAYGNRGGRGGRGRGRGRGRSRGRGRGQ